MPILEAQVERVKVSDQICDCISQNNVRENPKQFSSVYENCINQAIARWKKEAAFLKKMEKDPKFLQKEVYNLKLDLNAYCPSVVAIKAKNRVRTEKYMYQPMASNYLNKIYEQGNYFFIRGQYSQAKNYFLKVLRSDSSYVVALDRIALCYRYTGKWDSTEYYFRKSLRIEPFGYFAIQQLGAAYFAQSKNQAALAQYRHLLELDPSNPDAYYGEAQVLAENSKTLSSAGVAIDRAISIYDITNDNSLCDAYILKTRIQIAQKEKKKAKRTIKQAQARGTEIPDDLRKKIK